MGVALYNTETGIKIGKCFYEGKYCLFVQKGQEREIYARFISDKKADRFLKILEEYDRHGGNDGITNENWPD